MFKTIFKEHIYPAVLAGMAISIAALCNLKEHPYVGALLFVFGLSTVVSMNWKLFTGAVGFFDHKNFPLLLPTLLFNIIGAGLTALVGFHMTGELSAAADVIVTNRLSASLTAILLTSMLCGFIMTVSVGNAKSKNWLPLIVGIPLFVVSGFPHCVADITYYVLSGYNLNECVVPWTISMFGNAIGGNIPTLCRWIKKN